MLAAPAYWALLSLAFVHALWRLVMEPHVWDKTPHDRDEDLPDLTASLVMTKAKSGREAA